ncbi:hypothetical protein NQ317_001719 [Molorchus minor]|uniref:Uncharacterized protein n=1 Tax=Molorchus minor TaxID=1323400 RepID=A0ABQ9IXP8_9CUCU|nr:hypothetical protein NQ317_001719 [Molorchus minor]
MIVPGKSVALFPKDEEMGFHNPIVVAFVIVTHLGGYLLEIASAFVEVIGQEATSWSGTGTSHELVSTHIFLRLEQWVLRKDKKISHSNVFMSFTPNLQDEAAGLPDDRSVYSEVSEYSFTFAVKLPKLIPSTYTDNLGVVMYFAKATVLISGFSELRETFPFVVHAPVDLNCFHPLLAGSCTFIKPKDTNRTGNSVNMEKAFTKADSDNLPTVDSDMLILAIISTRLNNTLISNCRHIGTKFFGQQQNNNANKKPYFKAMEFPFSSVCGIDKYALYMDIYVPKRAILLGEKNQCPGPCHQLHRNEDSKFERVDRTGERMFLSIKTRGNKPEYGIQFSGTLLAMVSDVGIRDLKEKNVYLRGRSTGDCQD